MKKRNYPLGIRFVGLTQSDFYVLSKSRNIESRVSDPKCLEDLCESQTNLKIIVDVSLSMLLYLVTDYLPHQLLVTSSSQDMLNSCSNLN